MFEFLRHVSSGVAMGMKSSSSNVQLAAANEKAQKKVDAPFGLLSLPFFSIFIRLPLTFAFFTSTLSFLFFFFFSLVFLLDGCPFFHSHPTPPPHLPPNTLP